MTTKEMDNNNNFDQEENEDRLHKVSGTENDQLSAENKDIAGIFCEKEHIDEAENGVTDEDININTTYDQPYSWGSLEPSSDKTTKLKSSIEDRALQAVLAERRRSLELSKSGNVAKHHHAMKTTSAKAGTTEETVAQQRLRLRNTNVSQNLSRELQQQKNRQLIHLSERPKEMYTDKVRAAAVTLGDQDIKTSLKVKQKNERRILYPEEMDSNVYLTEAEKNLTKGNLEAAFTCANKAVESAGPDPHSLLVRSRCSLLRGQLQAALMDAQEALSGDPSLVKALFVQAESLYAMGEFERALVIYHRGNRRRPDLSSFRKGIQKAREAILNAIGGGKFPEAKSGTPSTSLYTINTQGTSPEGSPHRSVKNEKQTMQEGHRGKPNSMEVSKVMSKSNVIKPIIKEIKTSKMVSKRLLGGLSSDKEFLNKLLSREDLSCRTLPLKLEPTRRGRRRSSLSVNKSEEISAGEIATEAKEALASLQYLEAFLWQRDPGGLYKTSNLITGKPLRIHRKKRTKLDSDENRKHMISSGKKISFSENQMLLVEREIRNKVSFFLHQIRESDDSALPQVIYEAENYINVLQKDISRSPEFQILLCHLVSGVGAALFTTNRAGDGEALLKDATNLARQNGFVEEEKRSLKLLARGYSEMGRLKESIELWLSIIEENKLSNQARGTLQELLHNPAFDETKSKTCTEEISERSSQSSSTDTANNQQSGLKLALKAVSECQEETAERILWKLFPGVNLLAITSLIDLMKTILDENEYN